MAENKVSSRARLGMDIINMKLSTVAHLRNLLPAGWFVSYSQGALNISMAGISEEELRQIASALNSHQKLLDACKLVVEWYENSGPADPDHESLGSHELWSTCKKAIKQAEGGT